MTFSFRAMSPEEIAARDAEIAEQHRRFGEDGEKYYWLGLAVGAGLTHDQFEILWLRGLVVTAMSDVTDDAVNRVRRMIR